MELRPNSCDDCQYNDGKGGLINMTDSIKTLVTRPCGTKVQIEYIRDCYLITVGQNTYIAGCFGTALDIALAI